MKLVQITPGAGGMYCGNCFRDNALVAALRRLGHDTLMLPMYLPMTLDEGDASTGTPTFFGGINVYLSHKFPWYRHAPAWLRSSLDSPRLLKWAGGLAAKTQPQDVGELTVSMLRGEAGNQSRELDDLVAWLKLQPRPDALYLSNALLLGLARRLRRDLGTRVIVFLQSEESFLDSMPEPWRTQAWTLLAERAADVDGWIAPSAYFAGRMSRRLGLPASRVHVVHNGIHLDGYHPASARKRDAAAPPVLGFFARMCPEKGLDIVVDAFLELRRRGRVPNLQLKVGGGCGPLDEPYVAAQKARLAKAGLSRDASFHPNVSRADKIAFYESCDVLSVPARQSEAFGLYVIESLAAATPLVQPDAATFPELLRETGGGVLCGSHEPAALADAAERLLLDPNECRRLGEAGQRVVHERFSDTAMATRVALATQAILKQGG